MLVGLGVLIYSLVHWRDFLPKPKSIPVATSGYTRPSWASPTAVATLDNGQVAAIAVPPEWVAPNLSPRILAGPVPAADAAWILLHPQSRYHAVDNGKAYIEKMP